MTNEEYLARRREITEQLTAVLETLGPANQDQDDGPTSLSGFVLMATYANLDNTTSWGCYQMDGQNFVANIGLARALLESYEDEWRLHMRAADPD